MGEEIKNIIPRNKKEQERWNISEQATNYSQKKKEHCSLSCNSQFKQTYTTKEIETVIKIS